jgi:DNA (cytosine-5)-methyltransferase 1
VYNPLEAHFDQRDHCPKCGTTEIEKTRSSLLVEWLRFLREKKPRFAIYENVKNITGSRFRPTFDLFVKELEDYGYNVYWQVLNAKNYGIPQNRERVYCVIIRKDLDNGKFQFPAPIPLKKALVDMLEDRVDEHYYLSDDKVDAMIAPPRSDQLVVPSAPVEEVPQTATAGTCLLAGIKLSKKGTQFDGLCDTSSTLLARDYKGFGNQQMTGVLEHNE